MAAQDIAGLRKGPIAGLALACVLATLDATQRDGSQPHHEPRQQLWRLQLWQMTESHVCFD
jgi:hypothetical protein